jgi:hypothetical protein
VIRRIYKPKRRTERYEAGQNCIMRSFTIGNVHKIFLDDLFREDKMGGTRSMHRDMRNAYELFGWGA